MAVHLVSRTTIRRTAQGRGRPPPLKSLGFMSARATRHSVYISPTRRQRGKSTWHESRGVDSSKHRARLPQHPRSQPSRQAPSRRRRPDIGNLRAEKDIVFGKGGDMDLTLDVYQPPEGVTPKRMAIIHLFGGGFFVGNKNAGYIINDAKALGARGYTNISANYRLQTQGSWPAQIHDVKAAIRWTRANAAKLGVDAEQDRRRRLLGRRHARR